MVVELAAYTGCFLSIVSLVWNGHLETDQEKLEERIAALERHREVDKAKEVIPAATPDIEKKAVEDFSVDRKPRRVPWSQRKRELELQSRTKRKAMEEWRDDGAEQS